VDPAASRALFDDEVGAMRGSAMFKAWPIISAEYPDLVVEFPHPNGLRRLFRFRCDDWDDQAPSVKSIDVDGRELANEPTGALFMRLNVCL
jgi:hypothetical protein